MTAMEDVFRRNVVPLLEEYFFEDWNKIQYVLRDDKKPTAARFILDDTVDQDDLDRLDGDEHRLDGDASGRLYKVQTEAFQNPKAYLGIYETA